LPGSRTSPVDQGNLNRSFPGKPDGTVTQKIAHYVDTVLIPMADIVLDYHSGGKTLDFVPFAAAHVLENKDQQAACVAAMQAFNAPYSATMLEIDSVGMLDTAVEQKGKVFVTTELGGGGTATARSIGIAKKGARNLLKHAGILSGEQELSPTVTLDMPDGECFVFCEQGGMIEPVMRFGRRRSRKGDIVARVWPTERTGAELRVEYQAKRSGILMARHFPGLVKMGDCLAVVAKVV
jgi:N-alpha-acetyl-L-2,4-diaminobutyrate deacetylase